MQPVEIIIAITLTFHIILESPWFKNGKKVELPKDFYSSKFFVDQMIEFIEEENEQGSPFFAYLSFQAQHIPLQAPQEFIDKYLTRYEDGWEVLREKTGRIEQLKKEYFQKTKT